MGTNCLVKALRHSVLFKFLICLEPPSVDGHVTHYVSLDTIGFRLPAGHSFLSFGATRSSLPVKLTIGTMNEGRWESIDMFQGSRVCFQQDMSLKIKFS